MEAGQAKNCLSLDQQMGPGPLCGGGEFFSRRHSLKAKPQGLSTAVPFSGKQKSDKDKIKVSILRNRKSAFRRDSGCNRLCDLSIFSENVQ
jgi:hypothetical protein